MNALEQKLRDLEQRYPSPLDANGLRDFRPNLQRICQSEYGLNKQEADQAAEILMAQVRMDRHVRCCR